MKKGEISKHFEDCLKRVQDDYSKHAWDKESNMIRFWSEPDTVWWLAKYCREKFGENKVHVEVTIRRTKERAKHDFGIMFNEDTLGRRFDLVISDPHKYGERFDLVAEVKWFWKHDEESNTDGKKSRQSVKRDLDKLANLKKCCRLAYCCIFDEGGLIKEVAINKWRGLEKYSNIKMIRIPLKPQTVVKGST